MALPIITAPTSDAYGRSPTHNETLFGRKPIVPNAPDYVASLKKTIKGNIDLIPSLSELSTKSVKLYGDLLELSDPGSAARKAKVGSIIDDMLAGNVPKDVQRQLSIYGAERASKTGVGGDIGDSWTAQDFGNTSYAIQQQGVSAASRWLEQSRAGIFDFSKMFFGPQDAKDQADANFDRDWLAAQVAGAPDPAARGRHDSNQAIWGMAIGAYGGGAGYTQQYKPDYAGANGTNASYKSGNSSYFSGQERQVNDMAPMDSWGGGGGGAGNVNQMRPMDSY